MRQRHGLKLGYRLETKTSMYKSAVNFFFFDENWIRDVDIKKQLNHQLQKSQIYVQVLSELYNSLFSNETVAEFYTKPFIFYTKLKVNFIHVCNCPYNIDQSVFIFLKKADSQVFFTKRDVKYTSLKFNVLTVNAIFDIFVFLFIIC